MLGHRTGWFSASVQTWIEMVLSSLIGALAMSLGSASIITNALRLR